MAGPFQGLTDFFGLSGDPDYSTPTEEDELPVTKIGGPRYGGGQDNIFDAILGPSGARKRQADKFAYDEAKSARSRAQAGSVSKAESELGQRVIQLQQENVGLPPHEIRQKALSDPVFLKNILQVPQAKQIEILKQIQTTITPQTQYGKDLSPGGFRPELDEQGAPVTGPDGQPRGIRNQPMKVQEDDAFVHRSQEERDIILGLRKPAGQGRVGTSQRERIADLAMKSGILKTPEEQVNWLMKRWDLKYDQQNGGWMLFDTATQKEVRRIDPGAMPPDLYAQLEQNPGVSGEAMARPQKPSDPHSPNQLSPQPGEAPGKRQSLLTRPGMMIYAGTPTDRLERALGNGLGGVFPKYADIGTEEETRAMAMKSLGTAIADAYGRSARFKTEWETANSMIKNADDWIGSPGINASRLKWLRALAEDKLASIDSEIKALGASKTGTRKQLDELEKERRMFMNLYQATPAIHQIDKELELYRQYDPSTPNLERTITRAPKPGDLIDDATELGKARPSKAPRPRGASPGQPDEPAALPSAPAPDLKFPDSDADLAKMYRETQDATMKQQIQNEARRRQQLRQKGGK